MSEEPGTERESRERVEDPEGRKGTEPDEQVVGDDESAYGGAGRNDPAEEDHVDPGSGENRSPSELDEDQGI